MRNSRAALSCSLVSRAWCSSSSRSRKFLTYEHGWELMLSCSKSNVDKGFMAAVTLPRHGLPICRKMNANK